MGGRAGVGDAVRVGVVVAVAVAVGGAGVSLAGGAVGVDGGVAVSVS
jgi:hypothetical protein